MIAEAAQASGWEALIYRIEFFIHLMEFPDRLVIFLKGREQYLWVKDG
jgi:hypothetical protein